MWRKIPDAIKEAARALRRNMTKSEEILWNSVKDRKIWYKINRQTPIYVFTEDTWLDRYIIADFYCAEKKLIIELDWAVHDIKEVLDLDIEKEKLLIQAWYRILRFKNKEVLTSTKDIVYKIQEF